jgi:ferredoxin
MNYLSGVVTLRFEPSSCTGCGRCLEVCPREVFVRQDGKVAVTDLDRCMECGACMANCEPGALSVRAGVGCAGAVLNSMRRGGQPSCDCSGDEGSAGACCG